MNDPVLPQPYFLVCVFQLFSQLLLKTVLGPMAELQR